MTTLARITVRIVDEKGLVEVRGGEGVSPGVLPDAPTHIRRGARLRLRLHASALTGVAGMQGTLDVLGCVAGLDGPKAASAARCRNGLAFRLDVEEVAPALDDNDLEPWEPPATRDDTAPIPDLVDDDDLPTLAMPPQSVTALFQSQRALKDAFAEGGSAEGARAVPAEVSLAPGEVPPVELDTAPEAPPSSSSDVLALVEDTEPSGIFGTLREMSLVELLQSLELSRKTACVMVRPKGAAPGEVFVDFGRVVYARAGDLEGEEAFFALAHCRRGAFRVRFHTEPPARNIDRPTAYLVLEAHRRLDEEGRTDAVAADPAGELVEARAHAPCQLDDDAPTASERPYPQPLQRDAIVDDAPAPLSADDAAAEAFEERAPTSSLFSHFFQEASAEDDDDDTRVRPVEEASLTFTSMQVSLASSDESRTGM